MRTAIQTAFMCGISWECEVEGTMVKIYPSAEALKAAHECWQECGIVEVQLQPVRIVQEGEYL